MDQKLLYFIVVLFNFIMRDFFDASLCAGFILILATYLFYHFFTAAVEAV